MEELKEEILFEDETMKVTAVPSLNRIVVEGKTERFYEQYKTVFAMLPVLVETLRAIGKSTE